MFWSTNVIRQLESIQMLYYSVAAPSIKRGILFVKNMGNSQESLSFVPHFQIERAAAVRTGTTEKISASKGAK